jgi:hypothetical protein
MGHPSLVAGAEAGGSVRLNALSALIRISHNDSKSLRAELDVNGGRCDKSSGAPSPRISCKAWWGQRTSYGFPYRKPHTLPWLGPRSRKSGVLRVFCEGWDTTNLKAPRCVSHP